MSRLMARVGRSFIIAALSLLAGVLVAAEDVGFVVMMPRGSGASEGYTPLTPALKSVLRLATEHVVQEGLVSQIGNVHLTVVESAGGAPSAANLCAAIGANDSATYAVSALFPPDASYVSFYE